MPGKAGPPEQEWRRFERRVEQLLSLAGYEVEHDSLVGGGQTDLVAIKKVGPLITRLLVECKYSDSNRAVGIDAVENFSARVLVLRTSDLIDAGLLVTNTSFTRHAKALPHKSYLRLATIEQLYSMIFDFRPYLSRLIEDFERSKLHETFVRPRMDLFTFEESGYLPGLSSEVTDESEDDSLDIIHSCDEWLKTGDGRSICLLGDYGTGKTSFCTWYAAYRARKHLENQDNEPIPLLIPLHRFTKAVDIDALITDFLVNQCQIGNFSLGAFQFLLEHGRFLLLLDGFDEMARHVDREVRYQTITEVSKLCRGSSKVILTGRPSYFPTDEELVEALAASEHEDLYTAARNAYNELVDYDLYKLRPFSRDQIRDFVRKSVGDSKQSERILNYIEKRYDLYDLASRPVLLEMVVKSLPRLLSTATETSVNAAKLYDVYTGLWIDREHKKGEFRKLIRKEDKLRFMEELAFQLFTEDKHSLHHRQLGNPIKVFFHISDTELDYFSHDIRTCSFLHRIPSQGYTFAHRSFQEFFVAKKLMRSVKVEQPGAWNIRHLSMEIVRFASELAGEEDAQVKETLAAWAGVESEEVQRKNCLWVALLAGAQPTPSIQELHQMDALELRGYAAFKAGDDAGSERFKEYLYSRILRAVKRIRRRRRYRRQAVDEFDVLGDVFFRAYKLIKQQPIKSGRELDAYLERITTSLLLNEAIGRMEAMRREIGFGEIERGLQEQGIYCGIESLLSTSRTPEDLAVSREIYDICMGLLNERERRLVKHYFVDGLSTSETAEALNISPNTVRVTLHRMLGRLRRELLAATDKGVESGTVAKN